MDKSRNSLLANFEFPDAIMIYSVNENETYMAKLYQGISMRSQNRRINIYNRHNNVWDKQDCIRFSSLGQK
jgi:hypothetical protein